MADRWQDLTLLQFLGVEEGFASRTILGCYKCTFDAWVNRVEEYQTKVRWTFERVEQGRRELISL